MSGEGVEILLVAIREGCERNDVCLNMLPANELRQPAGKLKIVRDAMINSTLYNYEHNQSASRAHTGPIYSKHRGKDCQMGIWDESSHHDELQPRYRQMLEI